MSQLVVVSTNPGLGLDAPFKKETDMRKITSISFAFGALLVAAAPALAGDQQLAGTLATQQLRHLHVSKEAYTGFAQGEGYIQKTCTYIGGPKTGTWACR